MGSTRYTAVVRSEFFGPLIWSEPRHAYFIPRKDQDKEATLDALTRLVVFGTQLPRQSQLDTELCALGLDGPIRCIESPYDDRISAPLEVYFDYTWVCNLAKQKCGQDSFCYASEFLGPTTMRPEGVRGLIAELADLGVMRLHLAGGEPTINKRGLANYLDSASEFGLYTSMATNGLLINGEIAEIILRNNLKSISFSLDGASEETHGAIRGAALFDRTLGAIRLMTKLRDEARSTMRVCIKPTYEPSTPSAELERIVLLGIDLGIDVVKFANPERCLHHEQGHYGTQVDEYYEKIHFIEKLQEKYGHQVVITNVNNPIAGCGDIGLPGLQGCIGAQELLAINPDGSITPCLMHPYKLGDLKSEYRGIRDFWQRAQSLPAFWSALQSQKAATAARSTAAAAPAARPDGSWRSGGSTTTRRRVSSPQFTIRCVPATTSPATPKPACPTQAGTGRACPFPRGRRAALAMRNPAMRIGLVSSFDAKRFDEYPITHSLAAMRLGAYLAKAHPEWTLLLRAFDETTDGEEIAAALLDEGFDVIGLPAYIGTKEQARVIACHLTRTKHAPMVVCGGPETRSMSYHDWPAETVFVMGQGEEPLLWLCDRRAADPNFAGRHLTADAEMPVFSQSLERARMLRYTTITREMKRLPHGLQLFSNTFDRLTEGQPIMTDFAWYETARGCIYSCSFCGHNTLPFFATFDLDFVRGEIRHLHEHGIRRSGRRSWDRNAIGSS